jgi:histidyl-tRNA synthetase
MIKTPVRGMRDLTPSAIRLRDYVLRIIENEAFSSGYQKIETPSMEHIENLSSKDGGENEGLVFKVLKRGESLNKAIEKNEELADSGLRYDLTVPLARYFVNNQKSLVMPFKSFQIGSVWRADKPQRGRFRQFISCDMDILGDASILAEIDIILTTARILSKVFLEANIGGLTVHLNDRRILLATAAYAGFKESEYGSVLIALDKNDKIGLSGVRNELLKLNYDAAIIDKFISVFDRPLSGISVVEFCNGLLGHLSDNQIIEDLENIISVVSSSLQDNGKIIFDPTLVRGMGYYTGPIFECSAGDFPSSIAGGGRYDKMVGKISGGTDVAACGFGIGFERVVTLLEEKGFIPSSNMANHAILVDRKITPSQLKDIFSRVIEMRSDCSVVTVLAMNKNIKFQIEQLEKEGYTTFEKIYSS